MTDRPPPPALPPLPPHTRIRVERVAGPPDPELALILDRDSSFTPLALLVPLAVGGGLCAVLLANFALPAFADGAWRRGLIGLGCSSVGPLAGGWLVFTLVDPMTRLWLRVTPETIEVERVWLGLNRLTVHPVPEGGADLSEPSAWVNRGGPAKVTADLGGRRRVALTTDLYPAERAWVRCALDRVFAGTGTVRVGPTALLSPIAVRASGGGRGPERGPIRQSPLVVRNAVSQPGAAARRGETSFRTTSGEDFPPDHPAVRVLRDEPGRLVLSVPGSPAGPAGFAAGPFLKWMCAAPASGVAALLGAAFVSGWSVEPPPHAGLLVCQAAVLACPLTLAACPWRTVRITVDRRGVRRGLGWGRWRRWETTPTSRAKAVAVGPAAARGVGTPRPAAFLATGTESPPLTRRPPRDRPDAFAAAVAARVARALAELGWEEEVPDDWRFGWPAGQNRP